MPLLKGPVQPNVDQVIAPSSPITWNPVQLFKLELYAASRPEISASLENEEIIEWPLIENTTKPQWIKDD